MTRPRAIFYILTALVVAGVVIYLCVPKEPRYQGRKLSEWTGDMYKAWVDFPANRARFDKTHSFVWVGNDPRWLAGRDAVQHIGTNAIPWLLKMAGDVDTRPKRILIKWLNSHPQFHILLRTSEDRRTEAYLAFEELGDKNKAARASLIEWTYDKNAERRLAGLNFLMCTNPDKETVLPVLRRLMEDEDYQLRSVAKMTLAGNPQLGSSVSSRTNK